MPPALKAFLPDWTTDIPALLFLLPWQEVIPVYDSNIKQDTGGEFVSEGMFFPEQPCYHIEILEWIDKEDITDEWRYVWMYDPPEPVYSVTLGGFVEPLSLAFVYECIYTKSEYEQIKQTGFDYQTLSWMTHILTDCPDDFDYEKAEPRKAGGVTKQLPRFLRFLRRKTNWAVFSLYWRLQKPCSFSVWLFQYLSFHFACADK